jgi:hypothetical protein
MVINYPRARVHSQASDWTLRHALLIANVDNATFKAITEQHDIVKRRVLFANYISAARHHDIPTFVDPAPQLIADLGLPPVQDALRGFFGNATTHPAAKEILTDAAFKARLVAVLDRLAGHRAIREVVQQAMAATPEAPQPPHPAEPKSDPDAVDLDFVNRLLNVALMLHAASTRANAGGKDDTDLTPPDAVTALYTQLAEHPTFRLAMEKAVGQAIPGTDVPPQTPQTIPDVSALISRLTERPAVLRALRKALLRQPI